MRSAAMAGLAVVLVLALVIPVAPEPGAAASVASAEEDDDDEEVALKRNTDPGQNATEENEGPRWRKPARPNDQDSLRKRLNRKPPSARRRIGTIAESPSSTEKVVSRSELIKRITQVAGNLSLSEWLQLHNLTLRDVLHGNRGVLTALTATPAPQTTPLPTTVTTSTTESPRPTGRTTDMVEPTTIPPRNRLRMPAFPRTTSKPRKLPTLPSLRKSTTDTTPEPQSARVTTEPSSLEANPAMMELDPMMSPDQMDSHTSKPRRIVADSAEESTHIDIESLDITTPRLTGALRAEIKGAVERFINAQVYSPGDIPDKYSSTRSPPPSSSAEPEAADTKQGSPATEAPSVQITRRLPGSQRAGNDSLNELDVRRKLLPPRRFLPSRPRNLTARLPPKSSQLPPTRITFPLPEMIPVKAMIADAIERGDLPATPSSSPSPSTEPSTSTPATSTSTTTSTPVTTIVAVAPGDEILDLLNSEESSKRLARILESRNMTLADLLQLRERGSSQLHFSDFRPPDTAEENETPAPEKPVELVPKSLESAEVSRDTANILQSFHEVPKYPFDSEEAASAASAPAVVEAPRRSPRLLPDSAVVIPVPQEADVVAEEADASDLADDNRFQFVGARAAVAVAAGVCGLAVAVFLSMFAACRWRQRRSMRRARSAILCEQLQRGSFRGRSLSPVLVNMSKSPAPYYSNKKDLSSRATSNTASNRHYYLWRSLRKAFQEDEIR